MITIHNGKVAGALTTPGTAQENINTTMLPSATSSAKAYAQMQFEFAQHKAKLSRNYRVDDPRTTYVITKVAFGRESSRYYTHFHDVIGYLASLEDAK